MPRSDRGFPVRDPEALAARETRSAIRACGSAPSMRLANGEVMALRRRKGNGKTLIDGKGAALDDSLLASTVLGAINRDRFETLFGLNHETLRSGGDDLLDANGDIGRLIVEAGGGLRAMVRQARGDRQRGRRAVCQDALASRGSSMRRCRVTRPRRRRRGRICCRATPTRKRAGRPRRREGRRRRAARRARHSQDLIHCLDRVLRVGPHLAAARPARCRKRGFRRHGGLSGGVLDEGPRRDEGARGCGKGASGRGCSPRRGEGKDRRPRRVAESGRGGEGRSSC